MPKTVTAGMLANLKQKTGTNPVFLVGINWNGLGYLWYSTRDFNYPSLSCLGNVISISPISLEKRRDGFGGTGNCSVVFSDTDDSIKSILRGTNVEKADALVVLTYEGLAFTDGLCVMRGKISGALPWSEGSRTITIEIESSQDADEFGYAPTPADYPDLSKEAAGVPWPAIFGKCAHVPAVHVRKHITGQTMFDINLWKNPLYTLQNGSTSIILNGNPDVYSSAKAKNEIWIENGENFPSGKIKIQIQDVIFTGHFDPDNKQKFIVEGSNLPYYENLDIGGRVAGDKDIQNTKVLWLKDTHKQIIGMNCYFKTIANRIWYNYCIRQEGQKCWFKWPFIDNTGQEILMATGQQIKETYVISKTGLYYPAEQHVEKYQRARGPKQNANAQMGLLVAHLNKIKASNDAWWSADADSEVKLFNEADPEIYVSSMIRLSEVHAVYGKKKIKTGDGKTRDAFVPIPTDLYRVQDADTEINGSKPTSIIFDTPLQDIDSDYHDDVYVTATSTVGPNVSDIIRFIILNYTDLAIDRFDFEEVRTKVDPKPSNFVIFDKRNSIQICQEIAWQAKCALCVDLEFVKLKYLADRPPQPIHVGLDNTESESLEVRFTEIHDIVTKLVGTWTETYKDHDRPTFLNEKNSTELERVVRSLVRNDYRKPSETQYLTYELNENRYGLRNREEHIYIYNEEDFVQDTLDFWGYRLSNCWKHLKLKTFMIGCLLELFDGVSITYSDSSIFEAYGATGVVEKIVLDPSTFSIELDVWTAVKSGSILEDISVWSG